MPRKSGKNVFTMELNEFLQGITVEDYHWMRLATKEYVETIGDWDIQPEVHAAAEQAFKNNDGAASWRLRAINNKAVRYGPVLKRETIQLLMNDPHILQYFSPKFIDGVLSRFERKGDWQGHD